MNRRKFLGTAGALSAAAAKKSAAAPARTEPLRARHWGPLFYDEAERQQLNDVLESRNPFRWYAGASPQSPSKVLQFEQEFARRMNTKYALGVTSGTAALQVALAALEIGPGDEVILPSWTWHSCFNTVVLAGGLPVCAEIDETFNIDPADIERHITPRTKVIMAVHLQGNPCQIDKVVAIARKHKLRVLEDCAQSVGASFAGKPLGSHGDIGIYSLQQNKTITAGEGGAVVTSDPVLFERAARFHDMGSLRAPIEQQIGGAKLGWFIGANYRMNEFTGGVLLAQIRKIDRIIGATHSHVQRIYEAIADLPRIELRKRPDPAGDIGAGAFIGFADKTRRDRFMAGIKAEGIPCSPPGGSVLLPTQPHIMAKKTLHPDWPSWQSERGKAMKYGPETCPRTIRVLDRFAGVPVDPKYTRRDVDDIIAAIRKVYSA